MVVDKFKLRMHLFGVLKEIYEFKRFLTREKESVKTEFTLLRFGYNINKLYSILKLKR